MAIFTSIKDVLNVKQNKLEFERLMEENQSLKNIKLNPTQMALSQVLSKTKELEMELEGYDNQIEIKKQAIEELNTKYNNEVVYQTREFGRRSDEFDNLMELKDKEFEDKSLEYEKLIQLKVKALEVKSAEYDDFIDRKSKEYKDLIQLKGNELEQKTNEYENLIETKTKSIEELNLEYNNVKTCIDSLKAQVITLEDDILMQSFGVYKSADNLMSSEKYPAKLQDIREKQIEMIKSKEAIEFKQWIINGNVQEDRLLL